MHACYTNTFVRAHVCASLLAYLFEQMDAVYDVADAEGKSTSSLLARVGLDSIVPANFTRNTQEQLLDKHISAGLVEHSQVKSMHSALTLGQKRWLLQYKPPVELKGSTDSVHPLHPRRRAALDADDGDGWDFTYAVHCYRANSSFTDPSCNCLSKTKHAAYDTQPTVVVVIGSWLAGAIDAFLLKIVLEQELGYPTVLVSDEDPWLYVVMAFYSYGPI